MTAGETHQAIEAIFRIERARLIAGLARVVRNVDLAEELAQDALVIALSEWPRTSVPANPGTWLMTVAKRRAIDAIRRDKMRERKHEEIARELDAEFDGTAEVIEVAINDDLGDELLGLIFTACHPVLSADARAALTLRVIGGLTTDEIARASCRARRRSPSVTEPPLFVIRCFEFKPDMQLDRMQIGETVNVNRRTLTPEWTARDVGAEQSTGTETIRVKLIGIAARELDGASLRQYSYEIDDPKPPTQCRGGARVYIADLDFDLDAISAGRIARVERGDALSSEDFQLLLAGRNTPDPVVTKCLAELRSSDSHRAAARAFRVLADEFTAKSFPASGVDYFIKHGTEPVASLMEQTNPKACFTHWRDRSK